MKPAGLASCWRRRLLSLLLLAGLCLALPAAGPPPAPATSGQDSYEALRLASEAFYEIGQKYVQPKDEGELMQGALRGMMNALDPDSSYLTPEEYREFQRGGRSAPAEAGLELIYKDHLLTAVSVLDHGPAARAGLKPGDLILKINGQLVRNLTTQEGMRRFQGPPGTVIRVQVVRNGLPKPLDLSITLEPLPPPKLTSQVLKGDFAYIRIPYFQDDTPAVLAGVLRDLKRQHPGLKGLILDLRNNARGSLEQAVRTASLLVGNREVVSTRGRKGGESQVYRGKEQDLVFKTLPPTVVLVDQGTARGAEIVSGALQDHGLATLLGDKTFGLCGITKAFPLKDGAAVIMTVAAAHTPKGRKITGNGLAPDVEGKKPAPGEPAAAPPSLEQDPWILQALDYFKRGAAPAKHS